MVSGGANAIGIFGRYRIVRGSWGLMCVGLGPWQQENAEVYEHASVVQEQKANLSDMQIK